MEIDINLDTTQVKTLVQQVLKEVSIEPLKSYESLVTTENSECIYYDVYYKGEKINNVTKLVMDNRKND